MEEGQTAGSEMFTVWRDGVLLSTNMTDTLTSHNGLNRVQFGDPSGGNTGGEVDIDYFRFTKGAYAPLPSTMEEKASSDFGTYKYEMDSKPSAEDLEPNSTNDFGERLTTGGSSTLNGDGTLKLTSLNAIATYESNTPDCAWRTLVPTLASGYTLEIRLRVNSQLDSTYGVMYISSAASDSNADSMLRIGADFVKWGNTTQTILQSGISNSDDFHIFRIAMEEGQTAGSEMFTVWRDGALLSANITDALGNDGLNRVVFGDGASGSAGGEVDIDYFRFTKGAYAPVIPSAGTLVLIQ
jgi:hypothetical protein